jgi:phosphoenolpyruvate phosphomutase
MKALLLNSGIGKRMGDLTKDKPKCLVDVADNETILSRQIKALLNNGIEDIIITTGPFQERIKEYLKDVFPDLKVDYVTNPVYDSTNYIYSMLLAKELLDDDLILMHGDLVFEEALLEKTIKAAEKDTVLVNPQAKLPEKDFKARIKDGKVTEISINIFGPDCFFLIPLYKLSKSLCDKWLAEMELFEQRGELGVYAEEALNQILPKENLYPLYYHEEFCSEIDNIGDLENVVDALAALK